MNYEDMEVDEYHRQKEIKNNELIDCCFFVVVVSVAIAVVCAAYKLVVWLVDKQ